MSRRRFPVPYVGPPPIGTVEQVNKVLYHPRGGKCFFRFDKFVDDGKEVTSQVICACGATELRGHVHQLKNPTAEWNPINGDGKVTLKCWMCGKSWTHEFEQKVPTLTDMVRKAEQQEGLQ